MPSLWLMPFDITITREFAASHQLRLYDGSMEKLHGHNWRIRVTVRAAQLDSIGIVMDFHRLERLLDTLLAPCRERHLNDLPAFASINPSAENVACFIARGLALPGDVQLRCVEVWETPANSAIYWP